jgi:hypothetical protein
VAPRSTRRRRRRRRKRGGRHHRRHHRRGGGCARRPGCGGGPAAAPERRRRSGQMTRSPVPTWAGAGICWTGCASWALPPARVSACLRAELDLMFARRNNELACLCTDAHYVRSNGSVHVRAKGRKSHRLLLRELVHSQLPHGSLARRETCTLAGSGLGCNGRTPHAHTHTHPVRGGGPVTPPAAHIAIGTAPPPPPP